MTKFAPEKYGCGKCLVNRRCPLECNSKKVEEEKKALWLLVNSFRLEMDKKLYLKAEGGHTGWAAEEWTIDEIKLRMIDHIEKGDPIDIANFAAFWWNKLQG